MIRWVCTLLIGLSFGALAPEPAAAWTAPARGWHASKAPVAAAYRRRYRARRAPVRRVARKPVPAPPKPPVENAGPLYIGDLYIKTAGAPLYTWPLPKGRLLAQLPKATIVTNMGRYGAYYKVEAPNGAVGYVHVKALSSEPVAW